MQPSTPVTTYDPQTHITTYTLTGADCRLPPGSFPARLRWDAHGWTRVKACLMAADHSCLAVQYVPDASDYPAMVTLVNPAPWAEA